jgi:hypothetical protein
MATRMSDNRGVRECRVFYRDYHNAVSIPSTQPETLAADRLAALADRLLIEGDNFLGVIDRNDLILQCYVADRSDEITIELVYPEASGCLRLTLPREQALDRLDHLPETFDESMLSGAQYID